MSTGAYRAIQGLLRGFHDQKRLLGTGGLPNAQPAPNPRMCVRADDSTGNCVSYSFHSVCGFFYVWK